MKQTKKVLAIIFIICLSISSCNQNKKEEIALKTMKSKKIENVNENRLRHMVIFKFNDDASDEAVQKISDSFNELPNHIPQIIDFEWGLNDSPENFHQGFTHCYMLTFNSEKERDSMYTPHPKHQEFVASLQPHLEKVFVVDYWTK